MSTISRCSQIRVHCGAVVQEMGMRLEKNSQDVSPDGWRMRAMRSVASAGGASILRTVKIPLYLLLRTAAKPGRNLTMLPVCMFTAMLQSSSGWDRG